MLTKKEKRFLIWLIPIWIIIVTLGTILWNIYSNKTEQKNNIEEEKEITNNIELIEVIEKPILFDYIEIIGGCELEINNTCINAYISPTSTSLLTRQLRKGIVLPVSNVININNEIWYEITFDEWLRYPERINKTWYIKSSENIRLFQEEKYKELNNKKEIEIEIEIPKTSKFIIIDQSDQMLYAYDNKDNLFMELSISTGIKTTPTPRGTFKIFKKIPSRYMQGPIPGISTKTYDLPGVPWNLYFTEQGAVIHGAYWHDQFGKAWSNGCVNLPTDQAEKLYHWTDLVTVVYVRD